MKKRILFVAMAMLLVVALCACGGGGGGDKWEGFYLRSDGSLLNIGDYDSGAKTFKYVIHTADGMEAAGNATVSGSDATSDTLGFEVKNKEVEVWPGYDYEGDPEWTAFEGTYVWAEPEDAQDPFDNMGSEEQEYVEDDGSGGEEEYVEEDGGEYEEE